MGVEDIQYSISRRTVAYGLANHGEEFFDGNTSLFLKDVQKTEYTSSEFTKHLQNRFVELAYSFEDRIKIGYPAQDRLMAFLKFVSFAFCSFDSGKQTISDIKGTKCSFELFWPEKVFRVCELIEKWDEEWLGIQYGSMSTDVETEERFNSLISGPGSKHYSQYQDYAEYLDAVFTNSRRWMLENVRSTKKVWFHARENENAIIITRF